MLQEEYFDTKWYKPLVVLANSKSLLNVKKAPKEVRECTIRIDELINYIKKDINCYDKSLYQSRKTMEDIANSFLDNNTNNFYNIADKYKNDVVDKLLESKLKTFRRDKSKKSNIPAYYVFTNEELIKLISNKPKTLNDLKNILPEVKIKCHGKEILNIINRV